MAYKLNASRRRQHPSGHTTKTGSTTGQATNMTKHDVYQKSEIWSSTQRLETGKCDSALRADETGVTMSTKKKKNNLCIAFLFVCNCWCMK